MFQGLPAVPEALGGFHPDVVMGDADTGPEVPGSAVPVVLVPPVVASKEWIRWEHWVQARPHSGTPEDVLTVIRVLIDMEFDPSLFMGLTIKDLLICRSDFPVLTDNIWKLVVQLREARPAMVMVPGSELMPSPENYRSPALFIAGAFKVSLALRAGQIFRAILGLGPDAVIPTPNNTLRLLGQNPVFREARDRGEVGSFFRRFGRPACILNATFIVA